MNMFNNQGHMNASSLKDALQTLVKYAAVLEENTPSNMGLAGSAALSDDKRDELISRAIMTQDGKIALAQAMANPIRRNLDYHGIARRALVVDPLN
jgi:ribonuclease HII